MDAGNPPLPHAPPPSTQPSKVRTWPHAVQATLVVIAVAIVVGLITHSVLYGNIQRPAAHPGEPPLTRIDLNHATRAELQLLPGVGERLAQRIEAYRMLYGPYQCIDDLRKVPGIGPKTIERLRPWLIVHPSAVAPREASAPTITVEPAPTSRKEAALPTELIDINTASAAELDTLPGIGPKLSQRIVDARAQAAFTSVDELRRVPGIGPKTMEKVRPYVTVGDADVASR
ncbi:MAG: helix-hairpin-helix domain-containing protein [Gemmataceae bacterium]|nr:helix-hairpin-helix domain-containing protein [Gemmataceae bacterium]